MIQLPGEAALLQERAALLATVESLSDEQFESGHTLCEGWAPRDVLAHVMRIDSALLYLSSFGLINQANARAVAAARTLSRAQLIEQARAWATRPTPASRAAAWLVLGDLGVHHQDVLRPLGRHRVMPEPVADAILREGVLMGGRRLLGHRIVPTDGGRPLGRGRPVRGTREALGLWLAGRDAVVPELSFG